jgi:penicillin-binding protein 2
MYNNSSNIRRTALILTIVILFAVLAGDLVKLQVFETQAYKDIVSNVSARISPIKASRGEIVDSEGKKLVFNEQGFSVIFDAAFFPGDDEPEERNAIINSLIHLFSANRLEWTDNLPIVIDANGKIKFKADSEVLIKKLKSRNMLNLNEYATAQNCFDALYEKYKLDKYGDRDARNIASVLFEMERTYFSVSAPFTFAKEVPDTIVALIKERSDYYRGVDVEVVPVRTYADGSIAPHILGMTGLITAEEYAELKDKGYSDTAEIGKSGMELAAEEYLRGKDGEKTVYTDENGNRTTKVTKEPEQGNTVVLTINSGMQKVVQDALEKVCIEENEFGGLVPSAGAAVVLSCKDASVLACASYPTYDISTYSEKAEELNTAKGSPLWNRALMSTYACGSTAKPSVAIAALEEKAIDEEFTVYCNGSYNYMGQLFKCEQAHESLYVDVVHAIDESCNTFFMKVGDLIGIDKMNEYRTLLGLGAKTGVELKEAVGVLDSPEYRASLNQQWLPGYTVQSAIGQAGNLWTPVQLANYVNTIANGGTRYRVHFIKSIKSSDYSKTVLENNPEAVVQTGISPETLDIVKRGMLEVGTTGYCAPFFWHLPVKVACKTGTSQELRKNEYGNRQKVNNGFLIAFAPYDDPQIAVACVGEGLVSGKYLASVVAAAVEYYIGTNDSAESTVEAGVLIP